MTLAWCRVLTVVIVAVSDVAVYVYDIYLSAETSQKPVGYAAHIAGAFAGLFVGILVLRNLRWERHERYIWAFSACVFLLLIGSAIPCEGIPGHTPAASRPHVKASPATLKPNRKPPTKSGCSSCADAANNAR